jgi:hypothetical protein
MGFEPTIPAFELAKTLHASDCAATVIGQSLLYIPILSFHLYLELQVVSSVSLKSEILYTVIIFPFAFYTFRPFIVLPSVALTLLSEELKRVKLLLPI